MNAGRNVGMMGVAIACSAAIAIVMLAGSEPVRANARQDAQPQVIAQPQVMAKPVLYESLQNDVSPRLDSIPPIEPPATETEKVRINKALPNRANSTRREPANWTDPVAQTEHGLAPMPAPIANFDGVNNVSNLYPPDTQGAVGPNHYVQWVNISFAIYNKSGTKVYPAGAGFAAGNTLWSGFGGACETSNNGDPITLYDKQAGRWLMAQFALPSYPNAPFFECLAVSTSSDPTGTWNRYAWQSPFNKMNDYPHFGVWPDGYYMSVNQFSSGTTAWAGQGVVAFERDKMAAGLPARAVYFDLFGVDPNLGGMLPSDLDGWTPPPAGSPNYFLLFDDDAWGYSPDQLQIFKFHVDWTNPASSTFTGPTVINLTALGMGFDSNMCNYARNCIPQLGTAVKVDAITDRLMYRLAYRNFGDHQSLVMNHTVDVNNTDRAGIRWYEIRNPGGTPNLAQAGTYSPDTNHRWMGSIAMDANGNMALGFSVSSASMSPAIRYVGRLATDPVSTLPQSEVTLMAGTGAQTGSAGRWGDYSMMAVDPTDDCTFWYTQEYVQTTGSTTWRTRIGSFKFPSCVAAPTAPWPPIALTGSVAGSTLSLSWIGAAGPVPATPSPATPATAYIIQAGSAPGLSDLATVNTGNTLTSFSASGVGTGEYYLRVRATNAIAASAPSNEIRLIVGTVAPGAPSALGGGASGSALTLSWTAPSTGSPPTAYMIEAGSAAGLADLANFSTGNTLTAFSASGVANGRYYLRVRGTNSAGPGAASSDVLVVVGPPAPGAPSGLTWSSAGSSISLSWTAAPSTGPIAVPIPGGPPTAYIIEAGSTTGSTNLANFSTGNTATSYSAGGIGNGTYFVRVKATNTGGTSGPSNEVALVVGCTAAPGAATSLHTNSNSGGTVQFGWTAPAAAGNSNGPTTYILEAGSTPGASNLAVSDLGGPGTTVTFSGIGAGTYYVRVKAKNLCGTSTASNEFTLIVL